ncbi:MAG: DUF429 domain-containing protein, partial [Gemmatimonadota bacterium]
MPWIAGVDGCKKGWFRASRSTDTGELRFDLVVDTHELVSTFPTPKVLALDIPIGLPERGARECDRRA